MALGIRKEKRVFKSFRSIINREETPPITDQYQDFRKIIIELTPEAQGIKPSNELPNVWGVLIESSLRFPSLSIAVMVLADEHTSIYASEGGAYLGINAVPQIAEVSKDILTLAEKVLPNTNPTTEFPIANFETVNFYLFTYTGAVMARIEEKELSNPEQPFASLYYAYHEILYRNRVLIKNDIDKTRIQRWIGAILVSLIYGSLIGVVVGYLFGNRFLGLLGGGVIGLILFARFLRNETRNS
jgi:hypothetical protein